MPVAMSRSPHIAHVTDMMAPETRVCVRGMRQRIIRHAAPLCLGLAAGFGFAPWNLWPFTCAALVALLWRTGAADRPRAAAIEAGVFAFGVGITSLGWVTEAFELQPNIPAELAPAALAILSSYLALYWAAAVGTGHWLARGDRFAFALATAALFMLTEWARGFILTGFGWNPIGAIWLSIRDVSHTASIIGALGLSGLTILCAGLTASALHGDRQSAAALVFLGALMLAFPKSAKPPATSQRISVVQANIAQDEKWREGSAGRHLDRYLQLTLQTSSGSGARMIFWPEAAITKPLESDPLLRSRLANALEPGETLFTGSIGIDARGAPTNSVFLVDDSGDIVDRYDKQHLVPFGEYLPWRPLASALGLEKFVPGASDFVAGSADTVMAAGSSAVGVAICYEIAFAGEVASMETRPAFIFNPSNDAWFGERGPPQHLDQARLRAIELGLPVIRATQTGISAVIRADGSVAASIPSSSAGRINTTMPAPLPPTVYAKWGHTLPLTLAGFLLGIASWRRWGVARG